MTENAKWTPSPPTNIPTGKYPVWNGDKWILEDLPNSQPVIPTENDKLLSCKMLAKAYLLDTDYAMLPDVKISNRSEFEVYRAEVRELYLNPIENPDWPQVPSPQWIE